MNINSKIYNPEIKTVETGAKEKPVKNEKSIEMPQSAMRRAFNALTKQEQVKSNTDPNGLMQGGEAARAFNSVPKGTVLSLVNFYSCQKLKEGVLSNAPTSNKQNSIQKSKKEEINSSKKIELKEMDFVDETQIAIIPVYSSEQKIENCFESVFLKKIEVQGENSKMGGMLIGGSDKETGAPFKAFPKMLNATNLTLKSIGKGANKETFLASFEGTEKANKVAISTINIYGDGKGIQNGVDLDARDMQVRKQELNMATMVFLNI
ncbi:MAG: hypothetical protein H0T62_08870 [Parachlamydiaceae bacterium]|nr:hypothetical protein [Parachlamydiaceae bacterium]